MKAVDKCRLTLLQKSGISYPQPRAPFLNRIRFLNRILQWKEPGLPGKKCLVLGMEQGKIQDKPEVFVVIGR